ncbi:hypothetical protein EW146_g5074 [Bondarzewia mesenterica]|uniref:Amine oxidase n=1 Tax=Bondarzewia mesenterica TaxID=1095465 RepID=A0A4S4LSJ4_9AGAM|nr:hypothetical protein EW146_g5074 [Bondarzewia mesenterica]
MDRDVGSSDKAWVPFKVGVVGGGMAGLYAAFLLNEKGHNVHVFEASNRIGGRIFTHHFSTEKNQYFEAGAMRIPNSSFQAVLFQLIDQLNKHPSLPDDKKIHLIKYVLNSRGNLLRINGQTQDGRDVGNTTPADINWKVPDEYKNQTAGSLLTSVLDPLVQPLLEDFDQGFKDLLKFDDFSFRFYLKSVSRWPVRVIDFVETVCSQTNQFALSVTELVMQNLDFGIQEWFTIANGMDRLPQALAHILGYDKITFGARVTGIHLERGKKGKKNAVIVADGYNGTIKGRFDQVILAIPPAALKMLVDRPLWSPDKEMAIRSMHFESLFKMGMRFKRRFWELESPTTKGGQSTTDLPIRWIVYPSNGIGDEGPGVLLIYSWMTDSQTWLPLSALERRSLALHCLNKVYPKSRVYDLLMETFDVAWSTRSATGDAMFLPGQFESRFEPAREPEGNIYFAGEHLSYHHTWVAGALLSASYAVDQLELRTLTVVPRAMDEDHTPSPENPEESENSHLDPDFTFTPRHILFHGFPDDDVGMHPGLGAPVIRPRSLGGQYGFHPVGPEVTYLAGPQSGPL